MPSRAIVPPTPTTVDSKNPVFERSIKYHNTGFARASVSETCKVDCHGSFLWIRLLALDDSKALRCLQLQKQFQRMPRHCVRQGSSLLLVCCGTGQVAFHPHWCLVPRMKLFDVYFASGPPACSRSDCPTGYPPTEEDFPSPYPKAPTRSGMTMSGD